MGHERQRRPAWQLLHGLWPEAVSFALILAWHNQALEFPEVIFLKPIAHSH